MAGPMGGYIQPQSVGGGSTNASGGVASGSLGAGVVFSGNIASGQVGWPHHASGSVRSGHLGDNSVVSGSIASGQIGTFHFSSGQYVDSAEWLIDNTFVANEAISGGRAVCFNQSGQLLIAMASISGRMPAIGVTGLNYASGDTVTFYRYGRLYSTLYNFSGWANQPLYVGASGIVSASGAPQNSGNVQQALGVSVSQSGLMLQLGDALESVQVLSGDIASGIISSGMLGSGLLPGVLGEFFNTVETISGFKSVAITSGGVVCLAMAGSGLRLPAIGVVGPNYLSGALAYITRFGRMVVTSGLDATWSGMAGKMLYAGSGGMVVTQSGLLSGMGWQKMGFAFSGGMLVSIDATILSGGYTTPPGVY